MKLGQVWLSQVYRVPPLLDVVRGCVKKCYCTSLWWNRRRNHRFWCAVQYCLLAWTMPQHWLPLPLPCFCDGSLVFLRLSFSFSALFDSMLSVQPKCSNIVATLTWLDRNRTRRRPVSPSISRWDLPLGANAWQGSTLLANLTFGGAWAGETCRQPFIANEKKQVWAGANQFFGSQEVSWFFLENPNLTTLDRNVNVFYGRNARSSQVWVRRMWWRL